MKLSNNVNILPWYISVEQQNHRKDYATSGIYPLYAINSKPPPFQMIGPPTADVRVITAKLYDSKGVDTGIDISSWVSSLRTVEKGDYQLIINDALVPLTNTILIGQFYIAMHLSYIDGGEVAFDYMTYSEIITFVDSSTEFLLLEYWDNAPFVYTYGEIDYDNGFTNFVYLPTQVGKPDYIFEEDAVKRDGYTFIEKQISEKQYKFEFLAPEYLCDALRIVRMHDNIRITNKNGVVYTVDSILLTVKWQTDGDIAVVEAEFECDTVIKKIGKTFTPTGGDFNGDYNNDYI